MLFKGIYYGNIKKTNGKREECATLANIGYHMFEVNLEGEVYTYNIPGISEHCKAERVGSNKWKIRAYDDSLNCIEYVIPRNVLVGFAWYNIKESLWENSIYADTIRRYKEFFSIPWSDKAKTKYRTKNGFSYYVTRYGEVWNTETMVKLKGGVNNHGYLQSHLGSDSSVKLHRLVAYHFVPKPKDLSEENLVVNHIDGNKLNNRWDNLEWTTQKGNIEHAYATGLIPTTIDDHLRERIWQLLEAGYPDTYISKVTGVTAPTISCIRRGTLPRYRTDRYTWPKHSPNVRGLDKDTIFRELDRDTIFSIYDDFIYTDKNNSELGRKYNVSQYSIYNLRVGRRHSNLAREYIKSKGLDRYWEGYNPPPK